MKISIAISVLILLLAAILGWNNHQRIEVMTETRRSLMEEAVAMGLTIDMKTSNGMPSITKRAREQKDVEARLVAEELIAFALESEAYQESDEQPDDSMQEKVMELMDKMLSLDAGQLKILIEEFRNNKEMKDQTRMGMITFAIMTLANEHPKAALTLFTESEDMLDNDMIGNHILTGSLAKWASSDPNGALEWVRKNAEKYPDLITDQVKAGLVKGAGSNSIALGFDLLRELKLEDPNEAIGALAGMVKSPAERTEFLKLYRNYLKTAPKVGIERSIGPMYHFADGIVKEGFEEGSRWIAENDLTADEKSALAQHIGYNSKTEEKGQWIEWMGENLSAKDRDRQIESVMQSWTRNDFRAAGEWLAAAPESAAKKASVAAYARTVAPHDPMVAAQWALTLPPGEKRKNVLSSVYEIWRDDESANHAERDAFIAENPAE